jgi:tRNA (guanine26-N2/guanine27-N2)-dimethyltransferase
MNPDISFRLISEGSTNVFVFKNKESVKGPGFKAKVPFYNPTMEESRDLSVVVAQWLISKRKKELSFCDGLAASGIRGLRFANEVDGDLNITINDWDKHCYDLICKNIEKLNNKKIEASNLNLNTLLSEKRFDYIDIDPFGSPIYFINAAMGSIKNNGIIAITATDTAALCGTYPKVCFRRYSANPLHSYIMKEVGLRILLGVLCREAGVFDKAIMPILSYSTDHYFRAYVRVNSGVSQANISMNNFRIVTPSELPWCIFNNKKIGPLWMGRLHNKNILKELRTILFEKKLNTKNLIYRQFDIFEEETDAPCFFYTTDCLASFFKKSPPRLESIFYSLKDRGFDVFRTQFSPTGFKTNATKNEIEKEFK